jgi:nucleoside-diphosphate-sugar epimerase
VESYLNSTFDIQPAKEISQVNDIAIIGGSGFIGTRLIHRLKNKHLLNIKIIDKSPSKEFPNLTKLTDVRSEQQLRASIPFGSIVVNLAAEHRDDVNPSGLYDEVNVGGAKNICKIAGERNVKVIIFTSSVAVYGFAPIGIDETGAIAPFNDYGRTKHEAELVFKNWQADASNERTLVIIRPTVVFGEQNRGNVFNLLRQIASGKFVMIGNGENRKSMTYVENVAAFIEYSIKFKPGIHIYNFTDKPDFTMNSLVAKVNHIIGKNNKITLKIPFSIGLFIGKVLDTVASISGKNFIISAIRVKKFCSNSVYNSSVDKTGFVAPVPLEQALEQTIRHEFLESNTHDNVFYTE